MKKLLLLYSVFLILFTIFSYLFVDLNLIYMQKLITGFFQIHRGVVSTLYVFFVTSFFLFYYLILKNVDLNFLKKFILVSILILFFSYPAVLSYDIFNYIFTSKVLFFYHENPYIIMPIEFTGDPLLLFTHAANKLALYAPFWIILTGLPYYFGFGNFLATLFSFKLIVILFYLGICYLIFKLTKDPKKVSFFAFNPLVLIETLVSGHNDVAMIFFALLSIYFLKKGRVIVSIVFIALSILIKYATILLFPIFIFYFVSKIRHRRINWEKIYALCAILMFVIFFLSPIREEIYPWYGVWFISFVALIPRYKFLRYLTILLSFTLLLRYIPFMYFGTYFGPTPIIKIIITFVPVFILIFWYLVSNRKVFKRVNINSKWKRF